jgi:hypothetical protein
MHHSHNPSFLKHFPVAGITPPQYFTFNTWPKTFTLYNPTDPSEKPYTIMPNAVMPNAVMPNAIMPNPIIPNNNLSTTASLVNQLAQLSQLSQLLPSETKIYSKNGLNIKLCGSLSDINKAAKMLDYVTELGGVPQSYQSSS